MRIDRTQAITLGIVTALVAGFAGLVWWPLHRSIQSDRAAIESLESQLATVADRRQTLADLAETVRRLKQTAKRQSRRIASPDEMPTILREISVRIDGHALRGDGMTTGETIEHERVRGLPVGLTVGGPSRSVLALVESIERMPRMVQVDRLQISRRAGPGPRSEAVVDARMRLMAYLASPEEGQR